MPNGYIFLGSGNEDFDYCFTLDHFELSPKEKLNPYIQKRLRQTCRYNFAR